jgi:hypothetical protein
MNGNRFANIFGAATVLLFVALAANGHCDRLDGPVVSAGRLALEKGDATPMLKWVKPEYESEVRAAFAKTLRVRIQGPEAREIADGYFFETLVRLHRAGEGAPYTGLKATDEPLEPAIREADRALEAGALEPLLDSLTGDLTARLRRRFEAVQEKKKHAEENVEAGRAFVEAYVEFIHYVERLHQEAAGAEATAGEVHKH